MSNLIPSVGGPHVLLEESALPDWGGVRNKGGENCKIGYGAPESDYETACKIRGYAQVIRVGQRFGISFWGDRLDIGIRVVSDDEILIVRVGTDIPSPLEFAEVLLKDIKEFKDDGAFEMLTANIIIIDASEYGMDLALPCIERVVMPGTYRVLTHEYASDDGDLLVLHVLRAIRGHAD